MTTTGLSQPEPKPTPNEHRPTWHIVIEDMAERHNTGVERYGTALQPVNDRNSAIDTYQEMLDGIVYFRNHIEDLQLFMDMVVSLFYRTGFALPQTRYTNLTQLGRDVKHRMEDVERIKDERDTLYRERKGEVWFWSTGDKEDGDNAETLVCPVLIQPEKLLEYVQASEFLSQPIPMVLNCPKCHRSHIDREESLDAYYERVKNTAVGPGESAPPRWMNPPHKTHQCQFPQCKHEWKPAAVCTVGVKEL